ncbi:fructosamine kinase family protein [Halobacillus salinarum]|uniref:Fructosamine kinase family protein n=1 Tax=Halobacillus salinarum TaxID=2932257 RepID=A0ABY4EM69_9BACI|nr:fructosamine kinase family protein [Halobacillus salinarum]UOQ45274.1 fructosamine kinase family protein [Halobacillus salinarum]
MKEAIERALDHLGDHSPITAVEQVSGGDINRAYYVQTQAEEYFIKGNEHVPAHFFRAEAYGLSLIKETNTIHVPKVHYYDEPENGEQAVLVMDWIEGGSQSADGERLGHELARLHQQQANEFGLGESTFVGTLEQPNEWCSSWLDYYREFRLKPQLTTAIAKDRMAGSRRSKLETVISRLEEWITHEPKPALLHGDLWGGNWMTGPDGPYLIDPSVLYGDPAFELAFTELFGGFPSSFYKTYEETSPLPPHYEDIKPLYQLFYLLVHLNMFGEGYGRSVDQIVTRYVG